MNVVGELDPRKSALEKSHLSKAVRLGSRYALCLWVSLHSKDRTSPTEAFKSRALGSEKLAIQSTLVLLPEREKTLPSKARPDINPPIIILDTTC